MATRKTSHASPVEPMGMSTGGVLGPSSGASAARMGERPSGVPVGWAASWNDAEDYFHTHHEMGPFRSSSHWEDVKDAYRYGFESAGRFAFEGKSYEEVRSQLREGYRGASRYEAVEAIIRDAYECRALIHRGPNEARAHGVERSG